MKDITLDYAALNLRRQTLVRQLFGLVQFRRGSLTEQFLRGKRQDGTVVRRGPYPLLTRKEGGKTASFRLSDPELVRLYRQQIQTMRQFESVVAQLVQVGERLGDLVVAELVRKRPEVAVEQIAGAHRLGPGPPKQQKRQGNQALPF
jgi:hypothetical protein